MVVEAVLISVLIQGGWKCLVLMLGEADVGFYRGDTRGYRGYEAEGVCRWKRASGMGRSNVL